MFKVYQKYLVFNFFIKFFYTTIIFFSLTLILGLLEELSFLKDHNINPLYPYLLTFLNAPSAMFEIFPFIFLLTTQFLFYDFFKTQEIDLFKINGLSNINIVKIFFKTSLFIGIFIIIIFYNFAAILKFNYSNIKNNLSDDNKYLAMVTDSGLWIKDEIDNKKIIIKSEIIKDNFLINTTINIFDKNFKLIKIIKSNKIDIKKNEWKINEATIWLNNNSEIKKRTFSFVTNFNEEKIKNIFSDMSTLNFIRLFNLKKDFENLGYSSNEIEIHLIKLFFTPLFCGILTVLSTILMFNISRDRPLLVYIIVGILLSVLIYYINFIFKSLGDNGNISILSSILFPMIFLSIITLIGITNINEK